MKNFLLKNIPIKLHSDCKKRAIDKGEAMNAYLIKCIESGHKLESKKVGK
jgi:hypothetical protein